MMKRTIILSLLVLAVTLCNAQQPTPKLIPPPLQIFWGNTKGGKLPLEFVLNVIDSAVWVIDDKKNRYAISKFIMVYRSKDRYEDEQTGEVKTRFNSNSTIVRNAPVLEEKWRKMIYENLKPGDEILITEIIVRDKRNNFFKAPDLMITVN
ncbi:MAG: hypothetical protein ACK5DG_00165 [Chitinophagaceae bacterium]|jgi:hypothetical protein